MLSRLTASAQTAVHPTRVRRVAAAFVDVLLAATIALVPAAFAAGVHKGRVFGAALVVGAAYLLLRDGIPYGTWGARSLGKRWLGLWPFRTGAVPMDWAASARRNLTIAAPLGVPALAYVVGGYRGIPFGDWLVWAAVALAAVEGAFVLAAPDGRRLGDRWAGTAVDEARVE